MEIKVTCPQLNREIWCEYEFGESIDEMIEMFGYEVVRTAALKKMVEQLQNTIRRAMERGESDEEIQKIISKWHPTKRMKTDKSKRYLRILERRGLVDKD